MIDMHNDLLTLAYLCYLKNDYSKLLEFNDLIKKNNTKGIVANLYFMSYEEMNDELGYNYFDKNVSILDMFKVSKDILNKYIPDIDYLYSIEGCDYLNIADLKLLKEAGLNSILLVWNNPNKYGSGIRDNYGLTAEGIEFIKEAMRLNLCIDVSHANKNTCMDILNIIKSYNYNLVIASHSNINSIFSHPRNLDDEELNMLKSVNGYLGLVSVNIFSKDIDEYIEHIKYAVEILGIDNVLISTDYMDFVYPPLSKIKLFNYSEESIILKERLKKYYNEDEIDKILYKNGIELFRKIKER